MESSTIEQTPDMEQKFKEAISQETWRTKYIDQNMKSATARVLALHESALQPLRDELEECKNRFLLHEDSFKKWINSNQKTNAEMVAELERVKGERDAALANLPSLSKPENQLINIQKDVDSFGIEPLETSPSDMLLLLHLADHRLAHSDVYHKSCLRREMVAMFQKCAQCLPEDYTGTPPSSKPEPDSQDLGKLTEAMREAIKANTYGGDFTEDFVMGIPEAAAACAQVAMNFYKPSKP
jgi:hypothetical protein